MSTKERNAMMWRLSFFTMVSTGLSWLVVYLAQGHVPTILVLDFQVFSIKLPFGISRWFDIFIGPIGSIIIVWLLAKQAKGDRSLVYGVLVGSMFGVISAMAIPNGLLFVFTFNLIVVLILNLVGTTINGIAGYVILFSMLVAFLVGLPYGLLLGVMSLLVGSFTTSIKNWAMVKDKD